MPVIHNDPGDVFATRVIVIYLLFQLLYPLEQLLHELLIRGELCALLLDDLFGGLGHEAGIVQLAFGALDLALDAGALLIEARKLLFDIDELGKWKGRYPVQVLAKNSAACYNYYIIL